MRNHLLTDACDNFGTGACMKQMSYSIIVPETQKPRCPARRIGVVSRRYSNQEYTKLDVERQPCLFRGTYAILHAIGYYRNAQMPAASNPTGGAFRNHFQFSDTPSIAACVF